MTIITTKLVKDGNSQAIRLTKPVLEMSQLTGPLKLEVKKGQIIISSNNNPREGWREAIEKEIKTNGPMTYKDDYGDLMAEAEATIADGLSDL